MFECDICLIGIKIVTAAGCLLCSWRIIHFIMCVGDQIGAAVGRQFVVGGDHNHIVAI